MIDAAAISKERFEITPLLHITPFLQYETTTELAEFARAS